MFGSAVLELAIGIVFVFLLVSLICSQIGNMISESLKWRAIELENGIRDLILNGDPGDLARLYSNPLVQSLNKEESPAQKFAQRVMRIPVVQTVFHPHDRSGERPTNIPPRTFILAFFDTFVPNQTGVKTFDELVNAVNAMGNSPLKSKLLPLVTATDGKMDEVRKNVEDWFNGSMDRVTEIYKRNMWRLAFVIAIFVTVFLNVDTISVAMSLWRDPTLRQVVAANASNYVNNPANNPATNPQAGTAARDQALQELNQLNLPVGWGPAIPGQPLLIPFWPKDWSPLPAGFSIWNGIFKLFGWLVTALAAAQGAPFWFDLLKKLSGRDTSPAVRA